MEPTVFLKKNEEKRITYGFQWIFSNEIEKTQGEPQNGDIVSVFSNNQVFLGQGFYNKNSLIAVRLLTLSSELISYEFFKQRILSALSLREKLYPKVNIYRLIFGESDFLPGLIIDRFNDIFSIQTVSCGMENRIELIKDILIEIFKPAAIIEKNESHLRTLEGMESRKAVLFGNPNQIEMILDDIKYLTDIINGPKTGFFLDQRENRVHLRKYVFNSRTLDCFCNDGGFALNAAKAGAKEVIGIDISETAIERAKINSNLNHFDAICKFKVDSVFEVLKTYSDQNERFDVIILDPPSFTKTKKNFPAACKAYERINFLALKILNDNGFLVSSSCSHHVDEETFLDIIYESAYKTKSKLKLLEFHSASPDHPILLSMPETKYLKFGIFQVCK